MQILTLPYFQSSLALLQLACCLRRQKLATWLQHQSHFVFSPPPGPERTQGLQHVGLGSECLWPLQFMQSQSQVWSTGRRPPTISQFASQDGHLLAGRVVKCYRRLLALSFGGGQSAIGKTSTLHPEGVATCHAGCKYHKIKVSCP